MTEVGLSGIFPEDLLKDIPEDLAEIINTAGPKEAYLYTIECLRVLEDTLSSVVEERDSIYTDISTCWDTLSRLEEAAENKETEMFEKLEEKRLNTLFLKYLAPLYYGYTDEERDANREKRLSEIAKDLGIER